MSRPNFVSPLTILFATALLAVTLAGFSVVPADASLPVHWGISGEADAFMPRNLALLLLPGVFAAAVGLLWLTTRLSPPARVAGARHGLEVVVSCLLALALVIQTATVLIGIGQAVDMVRLVVLTMGLLFTALGNILPKSQPNALSGVRLPWTLASPANWQATNRLVGLLMLLGGLAMTFAAMLTGNPLLLLAVVGVSAIVPTLAGLAYSYWLSRGA